MRRLFLLVFATLATAQQDEAPHVLSITVPVQAWQRAHDESELRELLLKDIENASVDRGIVDLALRNRINTIAARLKKDE